MTESDQAVVARLASDLAAIAAYAARASADARHLHYVLTTPQGTTPPPAMPPPRPTRPATTVAPSQSWVGKALAVAGVAVTLVGVALLLVLAAQAGILRPEVRVVAGGALAAALVALAWRLHGRPGGRVGAVALAATGVSAAYVDLIAVTTKYHWVSAPAGLLVAGAVASGGLLLTRRWDAEALGLLVLVPLLGLAPVVADGLTPVLIGFMLALAAASVAVQVGRDWIRLHAASIAVATLPLLAALTLSAFDSRRSPVLVVACAIAGVLAVGSALLLLPGTRRSGAMAVVSAMGTAPVLAASLAAGRGVAAVMAAMLAAVLLVIVAAASRLNVTAEASAVFSVLAAVSAVVAVTAAFDGTVSGPVLLALAVVVATAGGRSRVDRWCALGLGAAGGLLHLSQAPLVGTAASPSLPVAVSILTASVLLMALAAVVARRWSSGWPWVVAVVVALYGITRFAVTTGVLVGGTTQGFYAGHVAATICWIAMAAAALHHATRAPRSERPVPIAGGMALAAAATAKLFLFDLGALDGIFRVVVFIAVGLALLGMGAGYARLLTARDADDLAN